MAKGKLRGKVRAQKPKGLSTAQAAEDLGVPVAWVRSQIAAGAVTPARSSDKPTARYILSDADIAALRAVAAADPTAGGTAALARMSQLETERANLLAQVAWERTSQLAAELDRQRARVEALKALSAWDRVLGRHKAI